MKCANCRHNNPERSKFCNDCGFKLQDLCAQCGTQNLEGAKFCNECGSNLQAEASRAQPIVKQETPLRKIIQKSAERRQLTCLFCDLVGSTTIASEMDAEDYRQYILDYQQIAEEVIARHQGHVGNYLGDGLLVYFGYPKGIENAPRTAVTCALTIIDAIAHQNATSSSQQRQIHVRMGIHTGLVVVDEQMALGSTVNIAARLEGLAETNTVVISSDIKKVVEGWFDIISIGAHVLKGIATPMEVFQVMKESGASSRIEIAMGRGLSPLIDREQEVYMLLRHWKQAKEGKGQLLLLNGEAGIGKSRLVESIKGQVKQEQKAAKLELRCSDYHVNSPFYPLLSLLEKRILQFEKEDSAESKATKLENWLDFATIDKKPNLPVFADFLSIAISDELRAQYENPLLVAAGKRKKFMDGMTAAFFNYALSQPLLLIVEDLHWMDTSTLEWLEALVDSVNAYPLFVLCTTRPQFVAPWSNKSNVSQLNLIRLNPNRIESICYHQTQGKALPKEILEQIKEKTDGVPLFVEELTRMIMESDLLIEKETHYELNSDHAKGFALAVPSTLQDSLIARLDNLSGSKAIAQIGAVLGREFSFEVLQAVAQEEESDLQNELTQLVSAELLYQRGLGRQATYIFKHALIQDTAYQSLLKSKRQQLHQQVVTVLEQQFPELIETQPELLAHHLTEADLQEKALLMWEKAANKAVAQNAALNAVHHFQKALSLLKHVENESKRDEKELALLLPYNPVLMQATGPRGYVQVGKNGTRILELCETQNNTTLACIGYYGLCFAFQSAGKSDIALSYIEKGLVLNNKNEDLDFRPLFNGAMAEINFLLGNFTTSKRQFMLAIQEYRVEKHKFLETLGGGDARLYSSQLLSWNLFILGYPNKAKEVVKTMDANFKEEHLVMNLFRIHLAKFYFHFLRKELQLAQTALNSLLSIIEESGDITLIAVIQVSFETVSLWSGSLNSFKKAKDILSQLVSSNFLFYQPYLLSALAEGCQINRMLREGFDCINEALKISQKTKERGFLSRIHQVHGELLVMDNQPVTAEQSYHQAISIAQEQSAKWFELLAAKSLARLWQSQGKTAEAYEVLNGVYSWFTEGFDTIDMVEAKELLGELETQSK